MLKLLPILGCVALAVTMPFTQSAEPGSADQQKAPASSKAVVLRLEPVSRLKPTNGWSRLVSDYEIRAEKLEARLDGVAFLAVCTNDWPAGLVPVFAVEKPGHMDGTATRSFQFFDQAGAAALKVFLNFGGPIPPEREARFTELRAKFKR